MTGHKAYTKTQEKSLTLRLAGLLGFHNFNEGGYYSRTHPVKAQAVENLKQYYEAVLARNHGAKHTAWYAAERAAQLLYSADGRVMANATLDEIDQAVQQERSFAHEQRQRSGSLSEKTL